MSTPFVDPLEHCRFDFTRKPTEAAPVYYLGEVPICTAGNLSTLLAQPKAGKTAFLGAMIASVIKPDHATCDTFGLRSANPEGRALLHFDTEQSPSDHWSVVACAMRRAQVTEQPSWLRSYCLTGVNPVALFATVMAQITLMRDAFGGIHSVLLDGYAELVLDVNDPKESQTLVTELHKFAIVSSCPIIGVLHYNPGSEKGRGHLGSQLERRAETNLALSKTKGSALTDVWSDKQRKEPILKGQGPSFAWNTELQMHTSVDSVYQTQQKAKRAEALQQAKTLFNGDTQIRYGALKMGLAALLSKSESTSERKIREWVRGGVILKNAADLYELGT